MLVIPKHFLLDTVEENWPCYVQYSIAGLQHLLTDIIVFFKQRQEDIARVCGIG